MNAKYKTVGEMYFHIETPDEVCEILSKQRNNYEGGRMRLFYGDKKTGQCSMEEWDTLGYIGCSCGPIKVPLLLKTKRSMAGSAVLDHCIIKIACDKQVLYEHPAFHMPDVAVVEQDIFIDGDLHARCSSRNQALRRAAFLRGERNVA